jgi:hypothetical protein
MQDPPGRKGPSKDSAAMGGFDRYFLRGSVGYEAFRGEKKLEHGLCEVMRLRLAG